MDRTQKKGLVIAGICVGILLLGYITAPIWDVASGPEYARTYMLGLIVQGLLDGLMYALVALGFGTDGLEALRWIETVSEFDMR